MKIGILGGGLTGLTIGFLLKQKRIDFEVLEKNKECGGLCSSIWENGFTFDMGGHIVFSKDKKILDFILSLLGKNRIRHRRNSKIFYKGKFVKYPFENGLADLPPEENFECLNEFIKSLIRKEKGKISPPKNFEEWIYATFGNGIADKYLIPYNEKIWKFKPRDMATFWIGDRVPIPPVEDMIKSSLGIETEGYTHQLNFYYPRNGGIQALPRALEEKIQERITINFEVKEIKKVRKEWIVSDGERKKTFDRIISTIPVHNLVNVLEGVPLIVKNATNNLKYNSLIVVMLGFNVNKMSDFHWLYLPDKDVLPHRVVFLSNYSPQMCSKGKSSLIAEITYRKGDKISRMSQNEILAHLITSLDERDLINKEKICFKKIAKLDYAYVIYDLNYEKNMKIVRNFFENVGIELRGRFSEFKYLNMDACIKSAMNFINELRT